MDGTGEYHQSEVSWVQNTKDHIFSLTCRITNASNIIYIYIYIYANTYRKIMNNNEIHYICVGTRHSETH
jgi:hypothetical protein